MGFLWELEYSNIFIDVIDSKIGRRFVRSMVFNMNYYFRKKLMV